MYFAYKYAKKKYKEREQAKAAASSEKSEPTVQPDIQQDDIGSNQIEVPASSDPIAASTNEKASLPVIEDHETPQEDPIEKKRRRRYRWKMLFGLLAPFALQALDTTIIASALPYIAQDFSKLKITLDMSNNC